MDLCCAPAHVGVRGNERVDAFAKAAAMQLTDPSCSLPASYYLGLILSIVRACWQQWWNCITANKMKKVTKFVVPRDLPYTVPKTRDFSGSPLSRSLVILKHNLQELFDMQHQISQLENITPTQEKQRTKSIWQPNPYHQKSLKPISLRTPV